MAVNDQDLKPIYSEEDIPEFASEAEEAEFWDTHYLADELWERNKLIEQPDWLPPVRGEGPSIPIERNAADRLQKLAKERNTSYQELARQFIEERLDQEDERARRAG